MKKLMTNNELVDYMDEKGILFNITSKSEAIELLDSNTYYTKISAFRKNYTKNKCGKYINLEFAYLQELSKIDMYLRKILFDMCVDIEHYLKMYIINCLANNHYNGYDIMIKYINYKVEQSGYDPLKTLRKHSKTSYSRELIDKHYPYIPIWVFLETTSMGDLVDFYKFFDSHVYHNANFKPDLLNSVKTIRNAGGHNTCIINNLFKTDNLQDSNSRFINDWISKNINSINVRNRTTNMKNTVKRDVVVVLFLFDTIVKSDGIKKELYHNLSLLFKVRMKKHKEYFTKNNNIESTYIFFNKIIDYLSENVL